MVTNLIVFYGKMTGFVDARNVVNVVHLDFSKAFDTVYHGVVAPH